MLCLEPAFSDPPPATQTILARLFFVNSWFVIPRFFNSDLEHVFWTERGPPVYDIGANIWLPM